MTEAQTTTRPPFKFEETIIKYQPLVFKYARKFSQGFIEFEDALSAAQEALVIAAREFERKGYVQGRQFGPYAKKIIYNAMCALYSKKRDLRKIEYTIDYQSIEHSTGEDTYSEHTYFRLRWLADPETAVGTLEAPDCFTQFEFLTMFVSFIKTLSPEEKFLVMKRLRGASQEDCAVMMGEGYSQSTVSRMLKELYIKYKEFSRDR